MKMNLSNPLTASPPTSAGGALRLVAGAAILSAGALLGWGVGKWTAGKVQRVASGLGGKATETVSSLWEA
ncbi:MAG: hypothetical protein A2Y74_09945 [Actinobacteria bacterium RBG_13_63_9]|nr:MAG: hypothetical protein A2Y74_09945 [Actinobacteria bacterium RBG_13_63_9]